MRHALMPGGRRGMIDHHQELAGGSMNKTDLIDAVAEAADISKMSATRAVDAAIEAITSALKKGDQVAILGFGTFASKARPARTGRNPKSGEAIQIAAANVPVFKPGKGLKDALN